MTTTERNWIARLTNAGNALAKARAREAAAKDKAARLAVEAIDSGVISERTAAELLGVNRMSLRAWLGKPTSTLSDERG